MILIRESQNGNIYLDRHPTLRHFPVRKVRGHLWLRGCKLLRSLPTTLDVMGTLDLSVCSSLTELPTTLRVGRSLWLQDTPVKEIPNSLEVGGDLYLRGSKVTHVPESAKIDGRGLWIGGNSDTDS